MIDKTDKIIINNLSGSTKKSVSELSTEIGISTTAVHKRIKKLIDLNIISGPKYSINYCKVGYSTFAFIGVFLRRSADNKDAISKFEKIPEIIESYYTTGDYSILLKVICKDNKDLMMILNKIQNIQSIARTETFISLSQQISKQIKL